MKKSFRIAVTAMALVGAHLSGIAQPIPIFGIVELSGSGTTAGTNYDNGVKLAVSEINAAGFISNCSGDKSVQTLHREAKKKID